MASLDKEMMKTGIRPNRHSCALAAVVMAMLYAGAAQQNGSAYLVAFVVMGLALVSWLHARANLRAVVVTAGSVQGAGEGEVMLVPLRVGGVEGQAEPCGIEITSPDALEPVFISQVSSDRPMHETLLLRAGAAGAQKLRLQVRSYYPLGFFTAQRTLELRQAVRVYPEPEGSRPLPEQQVEGKGAGYRVGQTSSRVERGGKDFHGVRPYAAGDSLKHVDWKALARGRPLMVKEYASAAAAGQLHLRWESVADLGVEQGLKQMAAWLLQAESSGLRYALDLPGLALPLGQGPVQFRRCMDALADMQPAAQGRGKVETWMDSLQKPPATRETSADVPGSPLALLLGLMALLGLPMLGWVNGMSLGIYYLCLLLRWWRAGRRMNPWLQLAIQLCLVIAGVAAAYFAFGSLIGIEPGMAVLLAVIGGKTVEARTARDFQIVAVLGWFICLCALLLEQGLGRSLFALTTLLLIATVLVRFRQGHAGLAAPLRKTAVLALQCLPLVLVLFFLFPRNTGGLAVRLSRSMFHRTSLSESMDPASVEELVKNEDTAFRASITRGALPPGPIYWRCMTLLEGNWFRWRRKDSYGMRDKTRRSISQEIVQRIIVEPHNGNWLPALDAPTRGITHGSQHYLEDADETLRSYDAVTSVRRYEVASQPSTTATKLSKSQLEECLLPPSAVPERIRQLGAQVAAAGSTAEAKLDALQDWFAEQGFRYTLQPGKYEESGAGMEDFLFSRRQGFCGHYASAFATLARLSGVPTRLVQGYMGGDYVENYNYYLVHQSDAHVWCECWVEGKGWLRVDPTAQLAPSRMTTDLQTYLGDAAADQFGLLNRNAWYGQAWLRARVAWDTLNFQWYEHIVQFDEDAQGALWSEWGLMRLSLKQLLLLIALACGLPLLALALWIHRHRRHPDPVVRDWLRFCQQMAKKGAARLPAEGPLAYAQRISEQQPSLAEVVSARAESYAAARYGMK